MKYVLVKALSTGFRILSVVLFVVLSITLSINSSLAPSIVLSVFSGSIIASIVGEMLLDHGSRVARSISIASWMIFLFLFYPFIIFWTQIEGIPFWVKTVGWPIAIIGWFLFPALAEAFSEISELKHHEVLQAEAKIDSRPPILYLRSISSPNLSLTPQPTKWKRPWWGHGHFTSGTPPIPTPKRSSLFLDVATAFRSVGRVVVLSSDEIGHKPGSYAEPVFLKTEVTEWFEVFRYLAKSSSIVLVVPEGSEGSWSEIQHIQRSKSIIAKTLVLMPPSTDLGSYETSWEGIRQGLLAKGLAFPRYQETGMLYLPKHDFSVLEPLTFSGTNLVEKLESAKKDIEFSANHSGVPLAQVLDHLQNSFDVDQFIPPLVTEYDPHPKINWGFKQNIL